MNTYDILCQKGLYKDVIGIIDEYCNGDKKYWKEQMKQSINDCVNIAQRIRELTTCYCECKYIYCEECLGRYLHTIKHYVQIYDTPAYQYIKKTASDGIRDSEFCKGFVIDDYSMLMYHVFTDDNDIEWEDERFWNLHDEYHERDIKQYYPDLPPIDIEKTRNFLEEVQGYLEVDGLHWNTNFNDLDESVLKILLMYYITRFDLYEYVWDDPQ